MSSPASYRENPAEESTPLLDSDLIGERPHWPRNRELGWLMPYGLKYPPPVLPRSLRGLQADLDSAWMELERQQVIANRVNLLTSTLALLITMGQPRRAEDRVRRLERIVEHIGRLYYSVGSSDLQPDTQETIKQTWKMIDEEEDRSELEERKAGSFGYRLQSPPSLDPPQQQPPLLPQSTPEQDDADPSKHLVRPRLKMRRASTLLGKHFSSYDSDLRPNRV